MVADDDYDGQNTPAQAWDSKKERNSRKPGSPSKPRTITRNRTRRTDRMKRSHHTNSPPKTRAMSARSTSKRRRPTSSHISKNPPKKNKKKIGQLGQTDHSDGPSQPRRLASGKTPESRTVSPRSETLDTHTPLGADSDKEVRQEDPDARIRQYEKKKFLETGDIGVFDDFMAPFIKGKKKDLSDWVYDEERKRWRRTDRTTDLVIWGPTTGSFL